MESCGLAFVMPREVCLRNNNNMKKGDLRGFGIIMYHLTLQFKQFPQENRVTYDSGTRMGCLAKR